MHTMTTPTLPQQDSSSTQAERARDLAWAKTQYGWVHSYTYPDGQILAPIAILEVSDDKPLPSSQEPSIIQLFDILTRVLEITGDILTRVGDQFGIGAVEFDPPPPEGFKPGESSDSGRESLLERAKHAVDNITHAAGELYELRSEAKSFVGQLRGYHEQAKALQTTLGQAMSHDSKGKTKAAKKSRESLADLIENIIKMIVAEAAIELLTKAGLYGTAPNSEAFARLFQTIVIPDVSATTMSDACFARMRIAGPNPLLLEGVEALPANFPVDLARFETITGQTLADALAQKRVYLVDYAALSALDPGGTFPAGQKYISPGLALFALSEDRRQLRPVAIQCGQQPGNSTPVTYADDGDTWELAKVHIQSADGNYHELISHLGLTHFLIEPFAVATHRNLAQTHPLFLLLLPHFQGTMFINESAVTSLIAPGSPVDMLLAGPIAADWTVTATALTQLNFNEHMLPNNLSTRRVADAEALPNYPYRDDALLIWDAIQTWTQNYLAIYYNDDNAVVADSELQAWYADLVSMEGGCVKGLGEPDPSNPEGAVGLYTFAYLVKIVTMIIFTGSAQHATVNFPQLDVMSYTPAMPLATYAPAPAQAGGDLPQDALMNTLPPLQMGVVQLIIGQLLGGVYFTRLGQYDRHQDTPYFSDPHVADPLASFHAALAEVERTIGSRNLERAVYVPLMPSRIPQSINI